MTQETLWGKVSAISRGKFESHEEKETATTKSFGRKGI